jgi:hypothetical protein
VRKSLIVLAMLFATTALAGAAEGTAVGVNPDAVASLGASDRVLQVGADISLGERVSTGASGQVQILFADQTRLVVGPQSSLLIESYLMTGSGADKFAINALAGSFRFISGNGPKSAYSIRTPTASIAVRGTKFDVLVEGGRTEVMLYEGEVSLCSPAGECQDLAQRCDIASFGPGGAQKIGHAEGAHRASSANFRFARFPSLLVGDFRVSGASQCVEAPAASAPASLSTVEDGKIAAPIATGPKENEPTQSDGGTTTTDPTDGTGSGGTGTGGNQGDDDDNDDQGENNQGGGTGSTSQGGTSGGTTGGNCGCQGGGGGKTGIGGGSTGGSLSITYVSGGLL